MSDKAQFGMVGMAVMGSNLALNILDHGFRVAGYNREPEMLDAAVQRSGGRILPGKSYGAFVGLLEKPRRIMMMIKAGKPVDMVLDELAPLLDEGDIVIDGGNSWYEDTRRRQTKMARQGIHFFGVGVSGGEDGARHGPSLMPGGDAAAYEHVKPVFEAIAATTDAGACVTHVGPDGAGHFVKMVHNGIEYADMQCIAESYDFMARVLGMSPPAIQQCFASWNEGPLESFLIEITAKIFGVAEGEGWLIDSVLDKAGQKGTGRWTAKVALDLGVPIPTIAAAIDARVLSSMKGERASASTRFGGPTETPGEVERTSALSILERALEAAKIISYAQGLALITAGSEEYGWNVNLHEIARIWKGGCIIRARFLDTIMRALEAEPKLTNLMMSADVSTRLNVLADPLRQVVMAGQARGIPVHAFASSLAYYDSYRTADLPQNLTQAQRDAFGSHTYKRKDDPEGASVHTDWLD